MRPNHIACLRSPFPTSPPPPILLESVKPWRPRVMSWKCTDASSLTRKHAARSSAWINGYSLSALNWIKSTKPKNEERLAGQGTDGRLFEEHVPASNLLSWSVDAPQDHGGLQARFIAAPCGQSRSGAFPHKVSGVGLQPASSGDNFKTKANSNSFQGRPSSNG